MQKNTFMLVWSVVHWMELIPVAVSTSRIYSEEALGIMTPPLAVDFINIRTSMMK